MLKWFKMNRCTVWPAKDCHGNEILSYVSSFQGKIFRIVQPECRCWRFLGPLRTYCRQKRQGQTLSPTSSICTGESPGKAVLRFRIHEIWSVESNPIHGIRIQIRIRSGPRSGSSPELGFFFDQALKNFIAGN